jgi:phage shock protein PspC (stress-responsive transcriptional regulator)
MKYYRLEKGSMLGGVCSGLESYTGIDSIFWRIGFIFIPSSGLIYFLMWLLSDIRND